MKTELHRCAKYTGLVYYVIVIEKVKHKESMVAFLIFKM